MPKKVRRDTVFIGIDPGKSGGLVAIRPGNRQSSVVACPMPETLLDIWTWIADFKEEAHYWTATAVIEKVRSSPQMGVTSSFTFGRGFGNLEAFLVAAGISFQEVSPQTWQKALGIPVRKKGPTLIPRKTNWLESQTQFKRRLCGIAQQMFPGLPLWGEPKSKGKQLAITDALLIAEFCRRRETGSKT